MAIDQKLKEAAAEFAKDLLRRSEECRKYGHRGPVTDLVAYSPVFGARQEVTVICQYCCQAWKRGLTEKENRQYKSFLESLREPTTI